MVESKSFFSRIKIGYMLPVKCFPNGTPYPIYTRTNIISSVGTIAAITNEWGCSESTVSRIRKLYLDTGQLEGGRSKTTRTCHDHKTLTPDDCHSLVCFVNLYPQVTLRELQCYLMIGQHVVVSIATISRELKRLGFTRKKVNRFSIYRHEPSRIAWWTNGPDLNGVAGIPANDLIDIDESHFYWDSIERRFGQYQGSTSKIVWISKSNLKFIVLPLYAASKVCTSSHIILAVSPSIGVVAYWAHRQHFNEQMFYIFLRLFVGPALIDQGQKFLMWDNLGSHLTENIRRYVNV